MDQPGKVANPARGQLNKENEYSPVPVNKTEMLIFILFGTAYEIKRVTGKRPYNISCQTFGYSSSQVDEQSQAIILSSVKRSSRTETFPEQTPAANVRVLENSPH